MIKHYTAMLRTRTHSTVLIALLLLCYSCADNSKQDTDPSLVPGSAAVQKPVITDTVILKLQAALVETEIQELEFNGAKPTGLVVDDISYKLISPRDYYKEQHAALEAQAKLSADKEKTAKALNYLEKMIKASSLREDIYRVQFRLQAQVRKTTYNEQKIVYLKNDLSMLRLVFPE